MFEEVKRLNKSVAIWLAIISLMSVGIVVGVFFITVAQPKHSQFCARCHNNITFNNACKKSLSEDIACIECHTHENKGMTVMATEIRDDHCTNDSCHPLTKLSAKPVRYKELKPFQHKTHLSINLNQIASLSPDQEEVKNSPDEKVFTREGLKDKFIEKLRLRCTSCHANIDGEKHFETDTSTCNTCHFISQSDSVKSSPASPSSREKNSLCERLTINNLNKFVVRYFEDQALSGLKPIPDPGRGQDSDKTVTNPSLKAGVSLSASTHLITPALRPYVYTHLFPSKELGVRRWPVTHVREECQV